MTHIKVEATHTEDERWIDAGGNAFAIHIAALTYSDRQLLDGRVSAAMARRVSLAVSSAEAQAAIDVLVERGFWRVDEGDYVIVSYAEHAFPAEQIKRTRARWKGDKDRKRQHDIGDHSLCKDPKFCPAIRSSTVEGGVESVTDSDTDAHAYTKPNPTRPNPTGGKGLGSGRGSADARSAGAPRASRSPDESRLGEFSFLMPAGYKPAPGGGS